MLIEHEANPLTNIKLFNNRKKGFENCKISLKLLEHKEFISTFEIDENFAPLFKILLLKIEIILIKA
mgnify:CR=1 FL=1